jgi:hypothetical protein
MKNKTMEDNETKGLLMELAVLGKMDILPLMVTI